MKNRIINRLKEVQELALLARIPATAKIAVQNAYDRAIEIVEEEADVWIPADEPPKDDNYILLSFENYSCPLVGRYEPDGEMGGAYYIGDCDGEDTCIANNLFVNAWMPLPEPYKGE